jgi:restriction system protein
MAIRYTREVRHEGLGKYRVISGTDSYVVAAKAQAQLLEWERKFQQVLAQRRKKGRILSEKQRVQESKERKREELELKLQEAEERTGEAQQAIQSLRDLLKNSLVSSGPFNWETLKTNQPFPKPKPKAPVYKDYPREPQPTDKVYQPGLNTHTLGPNGPIYLAIPPEPQFSDAKYQSQITQFDKVFKILLDKKLSHLKTVFAADHQAWEEVTQPIEAENQRRANELFRQHYEEWAKQTQLIHNANESIYRANLAEAERWNSEFEAYQKDAEKQNATVDSRRAKYESHEIGGIEDYCETILAVSDYPDTFPQDFDIEYIQDTKILVVEYSLPAPEDLPRLKEVKYVKSKDAFTETTLSDNEFNKLYDEVLYQICLRALHELFTGDAVDGIAAISFNGWVKSIDKATGKEANACVLSIQVKKSEFLAIKLENVDSKVCFKNLKGVGSSKLHSLTPVAPVLTISREDRRFIASHEVVSYLNEGVNLAAMDWEEFEQLIRQLFEQEFMQAGGEVKITQASRDGGVDAVAFDPDVIRGGKTVIQAKRYTNTVGVSAVRDLYGTVLNEGASKGILVTTSDYGPDSYDFAKGKPLVLLNGANLLNLLEKHGHKAKIDLREAKTILASQIEVGIPYKGQPLQGDSIRETLG